MRINPAQITLHTTTTHNSTMHAAAATTIHGWPYAPATNVAELATRRAFAQFSLAAAREDGEDVDNQEESVARQKELGGVVLFLGAAAPLSRFEARVLPDARKWCETAAMLGLPVASSKPMVWAGLFAWLAHSTLPRMSSLTPSIVPAETAMAAVAKCLTYSSVGIKLASSLMYAARLPVEAEITARDWTHLCDWLERRVLRFEPAEDDASWREQAADLSVRMDYVRDQAARLQTASADSIGAVCAALIDLVVSDPKNRLGHALSVMRAYREAVTAATQAAAAEQKTTPTHGEDDGAAAPRPNARRGGWFQARSERDALAAALAGHRAVWRIPRAQCRVRAMRHLWSRYERMRTYGSDADLEVRGLSLRVVLTRPPPPSCPEEVDDDDAAVIWIRYQ